MNPLDLEQFAISVDASAKFEGAEHGSSVSFFVVRNERGQGASRHRHPYDETFIVFRGEIDVTVDGERRMVGPGTILVIPALSWHEFTNTSQERSLMVNIHPSPRIVQEDWDFAEG